MSRRTYSPSPPLDRRARAQRLVADAIAEMGDHHETVGEYLRTKRVWGTRGSTCDGPLSVWIEHVLRREGLTVLYVQVTEVVTVTLLMPFDKFSVELTEAARWFLRRFNGRRAR